MAERIDGKGALFKNERKTSANHPDYTGNFIMTRALLKSYVEAIGTGEELKVNLGAWIKESTKKGGSNFLSLSVNAPFKKEGGAPISTPKLNDDIPF